MSETSQTTTAPAEIVELVQRFRDQQSAYRAGKYNETQPRLTGWCMSCTG